MKRVFETLGAVAVSALLLSACTKQDAPVGDGMVNMTVTAGLDVATRTALGTDGKVSWNSSGEKIEVLQNAAGTVSSAVSSEGKTTDSGATMTFGVSFKAGTASSYGYYALYPSSAYVTSSNTNVERLKVILESNQTPAEASFDNGADILISKPVTGLATQPAALDLQFARIIAVAKMKIADLNSTEKVQSITFTAAGKTLAGRSYVNLVTGLVTEYGYSGNSSDNIVLSYLGQDIAANGMTAYFTCWPCEFAKDDTFELKLETESQIFTKTVTIPSNGALAFNEGRASSFTVSFSGIEGENKKVYANLGELNAAILSDGATEMSFRLNLSSAAEIVKQCADGQTTYIQDATGAIMLYSTAEIPSITGAAEKTTIKGEVSGTAVLFKGLPEVTSLDCTKATIGNDGTGIYKEATIADLLADFNKYLNCKVKLTGVTVKTAFSNSSASGELAQNGSEIPVYVKNKKEEFSYKALTIGDIYAYPAIYGTTKQLYFWDKDDFTSSGIVQTEITGLNSSYNMNVGSTITLAAAASSGATVKYASADTGIATVSSDGVVTGIKEGSVEVTASVDAVTGYSAASVTTTVNVSPAGTSVCAYTLSATNKGKNASYAASCDIAIEGITWNVTGNSSQSGNYWRIGGKNISGVDRAIYSKNPIADKIIKVEVTHGASGKITVNSMKLMVFDTATDAAAGTNPTATLDGTYAAGGTTVFTPDSSADWTGKYYRIVYNMTNTTSSNKYVEFAKAEFYK